MPRFDLYNLTITQDKPRSVESHEKTVTTN
jgi:hypothetical protein